MFYINIYFYSYFSLRERLKIYIQKMMNFINIKQEHQETSPNTPQIHEKSQFNKDWVLRKQKKIICPVHQLQYRYKCQHADCVRHYVCSHSECIEYHDHNSTIILSKFDPRKLQADIQKAKIAKDVTQKIFGRALQIKSVLDGLKSTVRDVFSDIAGLENMCTNIKQNLDKALTKAFIGQIDKAIAFEKKISQAIEKIKSKIVIQPLVENRSKTPFLLQKEVSLFLAKQIQYFNIQQTVELFEGNLQQFKVQQFHLGLSQKSNLLLLLMSQSELFGYYLCSQYPQECQLVNDPKSFIFTADKNQPQKIDKYKANPTLKNHYLAFSHNQYIKSGDQFNAGVILSSDRVLSFSLPSREYLGEKQQRVSRQFAVSRVRIVQIKQRTVS